MDLDDAMERIQAGHIVTREAWGGSIMRLRVSVNALGVPFGWVAGSHVLTLEDMHADDWVDLGMVQ